MPKDKPKSKLSTLLNEEGTELTQIVVIDRKEAKDKNQETIESKFQACVDIINFLKHQKATLPNFIDIPIDVIEILKNEGVLTKHVGRIIFENYELSLENLIQRIKALKLIESKEELSDDHEKLKGEIEKSLDAIKKCCMHHAKNLGVFLEFFITTNFLLYSKDLSKFHLIEQALKLLLSNLNAFEFTLSKINKLLELALKCGSARYAFTIFKHSPFPLDVENALKMAVQNKQIQTAKEFYEAIRNHNFFDRISFNQELISLVNQNITTAVQQETKPFTASIRLESKITDKKSNAQQIAFFEAVILGKADEVRNLLKQTNVDINARNEYGSTALMLAVCWGNLDVVYVLMEFGADPTLSRKNILSDADLHPIAYVQRFMHKICNDTGLNHFIILSILLTIYLTAFKNKIFLSSNQLKELENLIVLLPKKSVAISNARKRNQKVIEKSPEFKEGKIDFPETKRVFADIQQLDICQNNTEIQYLYAKYPQLVHVNAYQLFQQAADLLAHDIRKTLDFRSSYLSSVVPYKDGARCPQLKLFEIKRNLLDFKLSRQLAIQILCKANIKLANELLALAARKGFLSCVKEFIRNGADPFSPEAFYHNHRDIFLNAIEAAVIYQQIHVVSFFFNKYPTQISYSNLFSGAPENNTNLLTMILKAWSHHDTEFLKILFDKCSLKNDDVGLLMLIIKNCNLTLQQKHWILCLIINSNLMDYRIDEALDILLSQDNSKLLSYKSASGETLLTAAATRGNIKFLIILAAHGAIPFEQNKKGLCALEILELGSLYPKEDNSKTPHICKTYFDFHPVVDKALYRACVTFLQGYIEHWECNVQEAILLAQRVLNHIKELEKLEKLLCLQFMCFLPVFFDLEKNKSQLTNLKNSLTPKETQIFEIVEEISFFEDDLEGISHNDLIPSIYIFFQIHVRKKLFEIFELRNFDPQRLIKKLVLDDIDDIAMLFSNSLDQLKALKAKFLNVFVIAPQEKDEMATDNDLRSLVKYELASLFALYLVEEEPSSMNVTTNLLRCLHEISSLDCETGRQLFALEAMVSSFTVQEYAKWAASIKWHRVKIIESSMIIAAKRNDFRMFETLGLKYPMISEECIKQAFFTAIEYGSQESALRIRALWALNVSNLFHNGLTVLMQVAQKCDLDMLKFLLKTVQVDPSVVNAEGQSARDMLPKTVMVGCNYQSWHLPEADELLSQGIIAKTDNYQWSEDKSYLTVDELVWNTMPAVRRITANLDTKALINFGLLSKHHQKLVKSQLAVKREEHCSNSFVPIPNLSVAAPRKLDTSELKC